MLTADRQIDRRILLEADSLESAGWDVTIIAMPSEGTPDNDRRVVRIGAGNYSEARTNPLLRAYGWMRRFLPVDHLLIQKLKRLVWRHAVDHESFFLNLFSGTVSRYSADIFVAHDLPMLPIASQAAERCGAKLVYDSHELYSEQEFPGHEKRRWAEVEAKHINACDAVITVNPSIAHELERRYKLRGVHVVYNAERHLTAGPRQYIFHEAFGLARDRQILLFQGGLSSGRNLDALIRAMELVKNQTVHLAFLGDGPELSRLQKIVQKQGLRERVHFHPAVPQRELLGFTASADAGVIPYQATCLNNLYCTPNKLFEFIAAGLPILASDLPEIRRIVTTYGVGMVGDLGSNEKLAELIDEVFSDSQRLQTWRSATVSASQELCWERESDKVVSIFESFR